MSRNGSGNMSIPNTMVAGTPITASDHNENYSDIASEITNSVAADGQTSMTGPLKASAGTAAAPSYTFASDPDTGPYRIGANNYGIAVGGALVVDVSSTGVDVTGEIKRNGITPYLVGEIKIWPGASIPSGFLACYGQSLLRASYPDLFAAIDTTYGAADGTHFSLPDLRGRVPAGKDDMGGSSANRLTDADDGLDGDTLGDTGGGETQSLVTANHAPYTPAGSVSKPTTTLVWQPVQSGTGIGAYVPSASGSGSLSTGVDTSQPTFTGTAQGGTSAAFGVVQPTIILNYIIFAGI